MFNLYLLEEEEKLIINNEKDILYDIGYEGIFVIIDLQFFTFFFLISRLILGL
jgi:hypothetical protein